MSSFYIGEYGISWGESQRKYFVLTGVKVEAPMHEVYAVLGVGSEVRKLTSKNQLLQIQEEHT